MLPNHQPGEIPKLADHEVHLWAASLDAHVDQLDDYRKLLSEREIERIERLKVPLARQRYVLSRGILRRLLEHYAGQPGASLAFRFGSRGKPSLAPIDDRVLSFNNTDCADLALYAFSWNRELGIDLEQRPRRVRAERIARRRFAASEASEILSQPAHKIDDTFLACWTRKEAFGKAMGYGIRYPMRKMVFCDRMQLAEFGFINEDVEWRFMQFNINEASTACLVIDSCNWYPRAFVYRPDLL